MYSRKHNDRQYDVKNADNIDETKVHQNIILHYDNSNVPSVIQTQNNISIDEHEHAMYEELFGQSLKAQHARNEQARHPERNKSIDDLLNAKNTCPEETIFQIGSTDDGFPDPDVLWKIFNEYQETVIQTYGSNIHFLDATLHVDEAVPHVHVRKVWTYTGKDGLYISQNKALDEMGIERPDLSKSTTKWNNPKVTFTEWERNLKLELCKKYGLQINEQPKTPGKRSLTKEEAIAIKLQEKNQEYREETQELLYERQEKIEAAEQKLDKVEAKLISEQEKNREISDTNILGLPKKISISAQEYRSLLLSAETKEHNDELLKRLSLYEKQLNEKEKALNLEKERLQTEQENLAEKESALNAKIKTIEALEKDLSNRIKNFEQEVLKKAKDLFTEHLSNLLKPLSESMCSNFVGTFQESIITVIKESPITGFIKDQLQNLGIRADNCRTINDALVAAEEKDILAIEGEKYSDAINEAMDNMISELANEHDLLD